MVFSEKHDFAEEKKEEAGFLVQIRFLEAPPEFFSDLKKVGERGHPCIAAAPEAIGFNSYEIFPQDPILYVVKGNFVAIKGYYGNFPAEKKVVDWVRKSCRKLVFN